MEINTATGKIAMVGDLHFGPRCETASVRERVIAGQHAFLEGMLDSIAADGITTVLYMGDIFTTRTTIDVNVIDYAIAYFERSAKLGIDSYIICGNHDLVYDDVDTVTSLRILEHIPHVHLFRQTVGKLKMLGRTWYMVPWITPARMPSVLEWLGKLKAKGNPEGNVIAGHFDIMGMLMEAGQTSTAGIDPSCFDGAAGHVFSGHYHCRSEKKVGGTTITYLGTPYHLSFAHVGTDCGYYTLDSDMNLQFIENTTSPRFAECYDDRLDGLPDLSNKFVRYFILNTRNFDDALARKKVLLEAHPLHVKPIPYGENIGTAEDARVMDDAESRKLMSADSITVASMYMDRYPDGLPVFSDGSDPKEKIVSLLKRIDSST